ncbi:MAG: D-alanyl-D-alanine carboxypeptidase, partial [Eubacteriales bacterium]|nr:D-alanyl-D-alanine carboxypeptidase [Eubacteriales bacterium]
RLISVVLYCGSKSLRASSSRKILDYAFSNYELRELLKRGTLVANMPVVKGKKSSAAVRIAESVAVPVSDKDMELVEVRYRMSKDVQAPVYAGVDVGTAGIFAGDELLGEVKLKVWEDDQRKNYFDSFRDILERWFKLSREGMFR